MPPTPTSGQPGLQGPVGVPMGFKRATSSFHRLVRVIDYSLPRELARAHQTTRAIRKRRH